MSLLYKTAISLGDRVVPPALVPFWQHPAGPKTVFFWAPLFKWGLVLAGIGDLTRPAEKLSIAQSSALAATGIIWSRYSLVIKPKNWSLFSVNVFVFLTSVFQLSRAISYQQSLKNSSVQVPSVQTIDSPLSATNQLQLSKSIIEPGSK